MGVCGGSGVADLVSPAVKRESEVPNPAPKNVGFGESVTSFGFPLSSFSATMIYFPKRGQNKAISMS